MTTTTVRIREDAHQCLKDLARETGEAMAEVLAKAIESYRRDVFLRGLVDDFAALRRNPEAWKDELEERKAWDVTLGDDLEDDGP